MTAGSGGEKLERLKKECEVTSFRAGGPGGQHQNVTDSAVRLRHIPSGIVVVARGRRSQRQNLMDALDRLAEKLAALSRRRRKRIPTRKGKGVRERELAGKKVRAKVKQARRRPAED
jgi:protein subunit release factor B